MAVILPGSSDTTSLCHLKWPHANELQRLVRTDRCTARAVQPAL
jgi:hypothetical protein